MVSITLPTEQASRAHFAVANKNISQLFQSQYTGKATVTLDGNTLDVASVVSCARYDMLLSRVPSNC